MKYNIHMIWVGTEESLSCFTEGTFINYSVAVVVALASDSERNIWVGTSLGITKIPYTD